MIKPMWNHVLVKPFPKEERKTAGGIILDTTQDTSITFKATIIAKGPDALVSLSEGETVILSRYQRGTDVEHEGVAYLILPDKDILGVI